MKNGKSKKRNSNKQIKVDKKKSNSSTQKSNSKKGVNHRKRKKSTLQSRNYKFNNKRGRFSKSKKKGRLQLNSFIVEIGISLTVMLGLFFLGNICFFSFQKVSGYGMNTILDDGDRVFVNRVSDIKRFDILCFQHPKTKKVTFRRVIGLPGEKISYEDDELFVDNTFVRERFLIEAVNEAQSEDRVYTENFFLNDIAGVETVPKDSYFVLGDNRPYSADSRNFGVIEKKLVIGVVKARLFPIHKMNQF